MVNRNNEEDTTIEMETVEDIAEHDTETSELRKEDKIKHLQTKLKEAEAEAKHLREESARMRAEFLNARKRLEEEFDRNKERVLEHHCERLFPLYDSFYLAMLDKDAWEKADGTWKKGIEAVFNQLLSVLNSYGVTPYDPTGELFDPGRHEALSNVPVQNTDQHDTIVQVIQVGFERTKGLSDTVIVRPARVTVGAYNQN